MTKEQLREEILEKTKQYYELVHKNLNYIIKTEKRSAKKWHKC